MLLKWATSKREFFVFTSNVDGHFQAAGFPQGQIVECHGSIHHLQCAGPCCDEITANAAIVTVDPATMRAADPLPSCPRCGGLARPNVLMFSDTRWVSARTDVQEDRFGEWLDHVAGSARLAIIECGAGTAVPTVRATCERLAALAGATLIRINPREPQAPRGGISLPMNALPALQSLDDAKVDRR